MVLFLAVIMLAIIMYEVPGLIAKKMWGELAAFGVLMAIGTFLALAETMHWRIPNPNDLLRTIFSPVTTFVFERLFG